MSEQAINKGSGKPQHSLVARSIINAIATVMTDSANTGKYPRENWRKGLPWHEPYDKIQRHLTDWWDRKDIDPESKRSALWHAACDLMILIEYEEKGIGVDDRWGGPNAG